MKNIITKSFGWVLSMVLFTINVQAQKQSVIVVETQRVARVTGASLSNETLPNQNFTPNNYDIGGTDLGIGWIMGNGKVGLFFGDTYGADWIPTKEGGPGKAGNWRSNVLGVSASHDLTRGLIFESMVSTEIIPSGKVTDGTGSHTTIPTSAIHVKGKEYVHFMEIRKWGAPGSWTTNFSGLYQSSDNGLHWSPCPEVKFGANSNFAQVGYAKKNGFVYMIGTKSGRWGAAFLARFKEGDILKQRNYEYWNKTEGWIKGDEMKADPIIEAPLGELSLMYHTKSKKWFITYLNEKKAELVLRIANELNGPWDEEKTLAKASDYPGLYGAFMYPVESDPDELYFLMSMWQPYNVFLMKTKLKFVD